MPQYNLVLTCANTAQQAALHRLSQNLAAEAPSLYVLGKNSEEHVSIACFNAEPQELPEIWTRARHFSTAFNLRAIEFGKVPINDSPHTYIDIAVEKTKELLELQESWIKVLDRPVSTPTGACYRPHFTLGFNALPTLETTPRCLTHNDPLIWHMPISVRPALGTTGPHGQLVKVLFK